MTEYQIQLLKTAIKVGALKFGEFTLKSGRKSPYFFNAGAFSDGSALANLAQSYADVIAKWIKDGKKIDILFGPAYKGIPLVAAISVCLSMQYKINLPWTFNRKEAKDHGEGGVLVGSDVTNRDVLIIDDVLTAGTAVKQSIHLLKESNANPIGLIVALDRQERINDQAHSALTQISQEFGIFTQAVVNLDDLVNFIKNDADFSSYLTNMTQYRQQYGV